MFSAKGCHDNPEHKFSHPFLQVKYDRTAVIFSQDWLFLSFYKVSFTRLRVSAQAAGMFLGELSCLAVFYILLCRDRQSPEPKMNPGQSFNPLLFFPPAMCDMTATSIMYVGKYVADGQM